MITSLVILFVVLVVTMHFSIKENNTVCEYHEWSNDVTNDVLVCMKCNTRNL